MNENNQMLILLFVVSFIFLSILFIVTLILTYKKTKQLQEFENHANLLNCSLAANSNTNTHQNDQTDPTHFPQTLLLAILPSKSAKWERLLSRKNFQYPISKGSGQLREAKKPGSVEGKTDKNGSFQNEEAGEVGSGLEEEKRLKKKKKKKGKKKRVDLNDEEVVLGEENRGGRENSDPGFGIPELGCFCPFTSMGSVTQRKFKELYHQLVQSCESNELTLAQVGEFTKSLAEAREELEDKAEAIKRKFSIKKALLSRADRSSMNRLRQQIYNLEKQQKRLEEDVCAYNWLQDLLHFSPACRKMLNVCADLELKTESSKPLESTETDEFADITFEELLAQEKKDSFWFGAHLKCLAFLHFVFCHCLSNYLVFEFPSTGRKIGNQKCAQDDDMLPICTSGNCFVLCISNTQNCAP